MATVGWVLLWLMVAVTTIHYTGALKCFLGCTGNPACGADDVEQDCSSASVAGVTLDTCVKIEGTLDGKAVTSKSCSISTGCGKHQEVQGTSYYTHCCKTDLCNGGISGFQGAGVATLILCLLTSTIAYMRNWAEYFSF